MPLTPDSHIGPYLVAALLGEGGMGEVYRATDTKLKREVAVKVLPASVTGDRERLARFQREAEVLASLNHPNIAQIYGLEESDGVTALVMELVDGEDLSALIARGPVPVADALRIATQIAEAFEAAHEQGIIHRDLKPANVKVRADGTVKVLDFGLAKAVEPPIAMSPGVSQPTITTPAMTQMGMILGTAAYMAPEQARGRAVDKRADIWAFGCVLYEMLTGRRAFEGDDVSLTLAKVLEREPAFDLIPASGPAAVHAVLRRCLQKDPRQRARDMGDVRLALDGGFETDRAVAPAVAPAPPPPWWRWLLPVGLTVVVCALIGAAVWSLRPQPSPPAVMRFAWPLPDGQSFPTFNRNNLAISPDGERLVYAANGRLYLRALSELDAKPIPGTEGGVTPVFSPDGQSVAFFASGGAAALKRIAITGGTAVTLCRAAAPLGMSWGPDGIVFGQAGTGILRVSPEGGTPEVLVRLQPGERARRPQILPGGTHVLFSLATGSGVDVWDHADIVVQDLASQARTVVIRGGSAGQYLPTGHLVYAVGGTLYAVPFDARSRQVGDSGAVPVVKGIRRGDPGPRALDGGSGVMHFSVSATGSLVFLSGPAGLASEGMSLALSDRAGNVAPLNLPPGAYEEPRVSPDGKRLAVGVADSKEDYIAVYDLDGRTALRRLTFGGNNRYPVWSRDSQHVTFQSDREGDRAIFWQRADGSSPAERLTRPGKDVAHVPSSWSPRDETLLFSAVPDSASNSLWTYTRATGKEAPFGNVQSGWAIGAVFSPDGRWVAYASGDRVGRGQLTVYVQPFPATGATYQLPANGGLPHDQLWSPDGTQLFYNPRVGVFEAVSVTTHPTFAFGSPVAVPRTLFMASPAIERPYDITPDGRFVGLIEPGQPPGADPLAPRIQIVVNWFDELKRLVPVK